MRFCIREKKCIHKKKTKKKLCICFSYGLCMRRCGKKPSHIFGVLYSLTTTNRARSRWPNILYRVESCEAALLHLPTHEHFVYASRWAYSPEHVRTIYIHNFVFFFVGRAIKIYFICSRNRVKADMCADSVYERTVNSFWAREQFLGNRCTHTQRYIRMYTQFL